MNNNYFYLLDCYNQLKIIFEKLCVFSEQLCGTAITHRTAKIFAKLHKDLTILNITFLKTISDSHFHGNDKLIY